MQIISHLRDDYQQTSIKTCDTGTKIVQWWTTCNTKLVARGRAFGAGPHDKPFLFVTKQKLPNKPELGSLQTSFVMRYLVFSWVLVVGSISVSQVTITPSLFIFALPVLNKPLSKLVSKNRDELSLLPETASRKPNKQVFTKQMLKEVIFVRIFQWLLCNNFTTTPAVFQ